MEPSHLDYTKYQHFQNAYKQHCFCLLELSKPHSRFGLYLSYIVSLIQTVMIIINPDFKSGLPWNYSSMRHIWPMIGIISDPDYFSELIDLGIMIGIIMITLLSTLIILKSAVFFKITRDSNINPLVSLTTSKNIHPRWLRAEYYLRYFLFEIAYIPCLNIILRTFSLILPSSYIHSQILLSFWTAAFILLCIEDSLFLQNVVWSEDEMHEVISMPIFIGIKRMSLFIVIYSLRNLKYQNSWEMYCTVLIGVGLYYFYKVYNMLPYRSIASNYVESFKAVILVWGGIVLFIAKIDGMNDQESYGASLLLFMPLPLLMYLSKEAIKYRHKQFITYPGIICLNQLFHVLQFHLSTQSTIDTESTIKGFIAQFNDNIYLSMWCIFYFMRISNLNAAKILLSGIEIKDSKWILFSYKHLILKTLKNLQKNSTDDSEALSYLEFSESYSILRKEDYKASISLYSFYKELMTVNPRSSKISGIIDRMYDQLRNTHKFYTRLTRMYDSNPRLLDDFASFLDAVLNSAKHEGISLKAHKAHNEVSYRYSVTDKDPHYFDSRNTIMIVSEKSGQIIWLHNSALLGYVDNQLEKLSFQLLIPEPVRTLHSIFFKRCSDIWGKHFLVNGILELAVVDRQQFLNPVFVKSRMMSLNDGGLVLLISIKPNFRGEVMGFLSLDGCFILSIVISKQTQQLVIFLCKQLECSEDEIYSLNILAHLGISEWQSDLILCEGFCQNTHSFVYVKTADLIIGSYIQKILLLIESDTKPVIIKDFVIKHRSDVKKNSILKSEWTQVGQELMQGAPGSDIFSTNEVFSNDSEGNKSQGPKHLRGNRKRKKTLEIDIDVMMQESGGINFNSKSQSHVEAYLDTRTCKIKDCIFRKIRMLKSGITIAISTAILIIYKNVATENNNSMNIISTLSDISLSSTRLAILSNELYLIDQGIYLVRSREVITEGLKFEASEIHSSLKDVYDDLDTEKIKEILDNHKIIFWEFIQDKFKDTQLHLLDFTRKMSNNANAISGTQNVTQTSKELMELSRNGNGKISSFLNETSFELIGYTYKTIDDKFGILNSLTYSSLGIMSLSVIFLVFYPLYKMHKFRVQVWSLLFQIPRSILMAGGNKLRTRISEFHDEELSFFEEGVSKRKNSSYTIHIKQKLIYGMVSILILTIYLYLVIAESQQMIQNMNSLKENILNTAWMKSKLQLTLSCLHLFRSSAFENDLMHLNFYDYDPYSQINQIVAELRYAHKKSLDLDSMSEDTKNYLYGSYNTYTCGYHAYTLEMLYHILYNNQMLYDTNRYQQPMNIDLFQLETDIVNYIVSTETLLDTINQEFKEIRNEYYDLFLIFTLSMLGFMVLCVFTFIFSVVNSFRELLIKESTVLMLLPKNDLSYILKSLSSILNS